jgi:hypothetical protein
MGLSLLTINGTTILMPTNHSWSPTEPVGVGGRGTTILTSIYSYPMSWDALTPEDFRTIWLIWFNNQNTIITAELPEYAAVTYTLKTYNCLMNPVTHQGFMMGHYLNVETALVDIDITA